MLLAVMQILLGLAQTLTLMIIKDGYLQQKKKKDVWESKVLSMGSIIMQVMDQLGVIIIFFNFIFEYILFIFYIINTKKN